MTKQEFLAFSLPYGLKFFNKHYEYESINEMDCFFIPNAIHFKETNRLDYFHFDSKPILHPLTDLTKEIEHNGERFVPAKILVHEISVEWAKVGLSYHNDEEMLLKDIQQNLDAVELWMALKLIQWHFDIASLIEKGEAIDVNALTENPYK